jgi:hypothetical protein
LAYRTGSSDNQTNRLQQRLFNCLVQVLEIEEIDEVEQSVHYVLLKINLLPGDYNGKLEILGFLKDDLEHEVDSKDSDMVPPIFESCRINDAGILIHLLDIGDESLGCWVGAHLGVIGTGDCLVVDISELVPSSNHGDHIEPIMNGALSDSSQTN